MSGSSSRGLLRAVVGATVVAVAVLAEGPVDAAPNASLGVYFDAAGTVCQGSITPDAPGTIYIVARTGTDERISGAEFRFGGLPASWSVYPVPHPDALTLGNPFGNGVNWVATPTSCRPDASTLVLYTVLVIATREERNVVFHLWERDPPGNPFFRCPLVTDCVVPSYEKHCVRTSPCFVNSTVTRVCANATAVEAATWSQLRELYR